MSQHTLKHTMCSLPMFVLGSPAYTAAGGDVALRLEYRPLRVKMKRVRLACLPRPSLVVTHVGDRAGPELMFSCLV